MESIKTKKENETYILIIDTNQYSGNFERELCAYLTGQIGDCGVGDHIVEKYAKDIKHLNWWKTNILQKDPDDEQCFRPVRIYPNPNYFNNGTGGHFLRTEEYLNQAYQNAYQDYKKQAQNSIQELENRIAEKNFEINSKGWTEDNCYKHIQFLNKSLKEFKEKWQPYPAYMSVGVFLSVSPSDEVIEEIKVRTTQFFENYYNLVRPSIHNKTNKALEGWAVEGFRLEKESIKIETTTSVERKALKV